MPRTSTLLRAGKRILRSGREAIGQAIAKCCCKSGPPTCLVCRPGQGGGLRIRYSLPAPLPEIPGGGERLGVIRGDSIFHLPGCEGEHPSGISITDSGGGHPDTFYPYIMGVSVGFGEDEVGCFALAYAVFSAPPGPNPDDPLCGVGYVAFLGKVYYPKGVYPLPLTIPNNLPMPPPGTCRDGSIASSVRIANGGSVTIEACEVCFPPACPPDGDACCPYITFRFNANRCISFLNSAGSGSPPAYAQSDAAGGVTGTLTCSGALWTLATSIGTWTQIGGCPVTFPSYWTRTAGAAVIQSIECGGAGCAPCACPTADCDTTCCPEFFVGIDGGIAIDGSGNFFGMSLSSSCTSSGTFTSGTPSFPTLTCTDGIWELDFLWAGAHQTYQAAGVSNGCCPKLDAANWTQTAGTHTLSFFTCKGDCRACPNSITFNVTCTAQPGISGDYTVTRSGCAYAGTGPGGTVMNLIPPTLGQIAWTMVIHGTSNWSVGSYMDENGCPRLVAAAWVNGPFGIIVNSVT